MTETAVIDPAVARVDATPEEIAAADIVVLLTEHDAFVAAGPARGESSATRGLPAPVADGHIAARRGGVSYDRKYLSSI